MARKYLADEIELDRFALRRVRGKLTEPEVERAKRLADTDVKQWIRELFGHEGDSHDDLERIEDSDGNAVDIAEVVIDDLFHVDNDDHLDRLENADYEPLIDLAEWIATLYLLQWGDFMDGGQSGGDDGSSQARVVGNAIRRCKIQVERNRSMKTTDLAEHGATRYYFNRLTVLNNTGMRARRKARR